MFYAIVLLLVAIVALQKVISIAFWEEKAWLDSQQLQSNLFCCRCS